MEITQAQKYEFLEHELLKGWQQCQPFLLYTIT